jgi:AraC-like DNA-binding protein
MVTMAARPPTHKGPMKRRASRRPMATRMAGVHLDVRGLSSHGGTGFVVQLPSLVVSIELSSMTLAVRGEVVHLDRTVFVLVPAGARLRITTPSPAARVAILGLGDDVVRRAARLHSGVGLECERFERWLRTPHVLPRTAWVHELAHRYVFERSVLDIGSGLVVTFLETELAKEAYFLLRDREAGADRAPAVHRPSTTLERALTWIEAHLFEPVAVNALARHARASESTLLRAFRRELGCTPGEHWRVRRLEEALVFLRAGGSTVLEVATRVGYESAAAFAAAFRRRYGRSPSSFLPILPTRHAPR